MQNLLLAPIVLALGAGGPARAQDAGLVEAVSAAHVAHVLGRDAERGTTHLAVTVPPGSREPLLLARPGEVDVVLESVLLYGPAGVGASVRVDGASGVRSSASGQRVRGATRFDLEQPLRFDDRGHAGRIAVAGPQVSGDPYHQLPGYTAVLRVDPPKSEPIDLRQFTGFETGDLLEFTTVNGSGVTVQSNLARSGSFALRAQAEPGNYAYVTLWDVDDDGYPSSSFDLETLHLSFQFAISAWNQRVRMAEVGGTAGAFKAKVELESDGRISVEDQIEVRRFSQTKLVTGRWYRIDLLVGTGTATRMQLSIDGQVEFDVNDANTTEQLAERVHIGRSSSSGGPSIFFYDDVVVSGAGHPGDAQVLLMPPTGPGSAATWLGDHLDVDDWPQDGDLTYAASNGPGAFTTRLQPPPLPGLEVLGLRALAVQRREAANYTASALRLRSGGLDFDTPPGDGGQSYRVRSRVFPEDPATGAAWTKSALGSVEVGLDQLDTSPSKVTRATALGATVLGVRTESDV